MMMNGVDMQFFPKTLNLDSVETPMDHNVYDR